jgi:curli production assembly/transport component CsgG
LKYRFSRLLAQIVVHVTVASSLLIIGCAAPSSLVPGITERAKIGYVTAVHDDLRSLPPPAEKLVVSVYKFRDQTGQFKQTAAGTGSGFSTAVTQGATSMLLKALEDSGWFVVLEREGLSNLLNERRIIRSTRENYRAQDGVAQPALPPLLYAGIMLEGGIVSYDTNRLTGGIGVRYFNAGGSNQFRQDQVGIYLRAVATQNGRVLKTVNTTKTILSQQVDVGIFRFVRVQRLLEVEAGLSYNEPPQMAVQEAIEKAVLGLIIEGIVDGNWNLENAEDINAPMIRDYLEEKQALESVSVDLADADGSIQNHLLPLTGTGTGNSFGVGLGLNAARYRGDYSGSKAEPGFEGSIWVGLNRYFGLETAIGQSRISARNRFNTTLTSTSLKGVLNLSPMTRLSAYVAGGASLYKHKTKDLLGKTLANSGYQLGALTETGLTYDLTPRFRVRGGLEHQFTFTDRLDGIVHGSKDDYIWSGRIGMTYFLHRSP